MVEAQTDRASPEEIRAALDFALAVFHGSGFGPTSFASLEAMAQPPHEFIEEEANAWISGGRFPLYRPRSGVTPRYLERVLQFSSHIGVDPDPELQKEADAALEQLANHVGTARAVLIDRDGQGWDLAEDRPFVCPERVYLDLYNGMALRPEYSLPVPPAEVSRWDWEALLGTDAWVRLAAEAGVGNPLEEREERRKERLRRMYPKEHHASLMAADEENKQWLRGSPRRGRIQEWAEGNWRTEEAPLLYADAQGGWQSESRLVYNEAQNEIVMSDAVWQALQLRPWGEDYLTAEESHVSRPGVTQASIVKGLLPFCSLELLIDVERASPLYCCRSCQVLTPLLPGQHRDRLCDGCRATIRRDRKRKYAKRRRSTPRARA